MGKSINRYLGGRYDTIRYISKLPSPTAATDTLQ